MHWLATQCPAHRALALLLSGCAAFRSYDAELYQTLDRASTGNVDGAIHLLESNNRLPDKDLLYYLELGMLQRLGNRYDESQKAWTAAERAHRRRRAATASSSCSAWRAARRATS